MAAVTVRNLDDQVKERLRIRAAVHGRSMESEVRAILASVFMIVVDTNVVSELMKPYSRPSRIRYCPSTPERLRTTRTLSGAATSWDCR